MREVGRYLQKYEADLACARLQDAGVHALVMTDNEGGMAPHLSMLTGVRVMVGPQDLETAQAILATPLLTPVPDDAEPDEPVVAEPGRDVVSRALAAAALGLVLAPVIAHIWSLVLLRRLPPWRTLSSGVRTREVVALVIDVMALLFMIAFVKLMRDT